MSNNLISLAVNAKVQEEIKRVIQITPPGYDTDNSFLFDIFKNIIELSQEDKDGFTDVLFDVIDTKEDLVKNTFNIFYIYTTNTRTISNGFSLVLLRV